MILIMRTSSVNTILLVTFELAIFIVLWLPLPIANIVVAIAHLSISIIGAFWLSQQWKHASLSTSKTWMILSIFLFFVPVVGAIMLWLVNERHTLRKRGIQAGVGVEKKEIKPEEEELRYFSAPKHHHIDKQKKTRDLISTLDDDAYLRLLISSRHLPDKEAYTLLREALSSPFESARLMAFSLKTTLEERLQEALQIKLMKLKSANTENKAERHLAVAKDYIHLLDIGLLTESNDALVKKARYHCISAIKLNKKSAYAYQTLSNVLKHEGRNKQAQRAQIRAVSLGLPLERLYSTS